MAPAGLSDEQRTELPAELTELPAELTELPAELTELPDTGAFFFTKKGAPVAMPVPAGPIAESHTHLTSLRHIEPALAVARAALCGVRFMVNVVDPTEDATDPDALFADLALWRRQAAGILDAWAAAGVTDALGGRPTPPELRLVVGCHPHNARLFDAAAHDAMARILADPLCCGVGEIGLDYHYDLSPREEQRAVFAEQLALACELDAPLSLHIREAHPEAAQIMAEVGLPKGAGTVLHCFDLGPEDCAPFLEMGCVLGIGGAVTFGRGDPTRTAVLGVDPARVLFETDAPYMAPEPLRGTRCEPAYIAVTAAFVADLRAREQGVDPVTTYGAAYDACRAIFDRPGAAAARG